MQVTSFLGNLLDDEPAILDYLVTLTPEQADLFQQVIRGFGRYKKAGGKAVLHRMIKPTMVSAEPSFIHPVLDSI